MERTLSTSLDDVRVHTGPEAAALSDSISARAFSTGNDIFFNAGEFRPESASGRHLIAHEVAHTLQPDSTTRRVVRREVDEGAQDRARDRDEFQMWASLLASHFDMVLAHFPFLSTMTIQSSVQSEMIGVLENVKATVVAQLAPIQTYAERVQRSWDKLGSSSARSLVVPAAVMRPFVDALTALPAQLERWRMYLQTVVPGYQGTVLRVQQEMIMSRAMVCGQAGLAAKSTKDGSTRGGSPELLASIKSRSARANLRHVEPEPRDDGAQLGRVLSPRAALMADIRSHGSRR